MACSTETLSIYNEAASISWGRNHRVCVTPVTGLVGGEYFKIASPNAKYAVWYSVNSVGSDPALSGYTSIEVPLPSSYTVAQAISLSITELEDAGVDDFLAAESSDGLSMYVQSLDIGAPLEAAAAGTSGFTLSVLVEGIGGNLGYTKDAIGVTIEKSLYDVLANQTGDIVLSQIIKGTNVSLSANLIEIDTDLWELIVANGLGDSVTIGSDKLIGYGSSKISQSTYDMAGKLIIHPIRLSADRSEDLCIWKTVPSVDSLNYDSQDTKTMAVSFVALQDNEVTSKVNKVSYGDWRVDARA